MTQTVDSEFADRLRRIQAARPAVPAPQTTLARPWRKAEVGLKLAGLAAGAVIGLKAVLIVDIGPADYERHRAALAQGTLMDQLAARMMTPDPVTMVLQGLVQHAVGGASAVEAAAGNVAAAATTSPNDSPVKPTISTLDFGGGEDAGPSPIHMVPPAAAKPAPKPVVAHPAHSARTGARDGSRFLQAPKPQDGSVVPGLAPAGPSTRGMAGTFLPAPQPDSP